MSSFASVYRLQFHAGFTFDDAIAKLPYWQELGVEAIYSSPIYRAVKGSLHGYDVVSPLEINPELGGEAGLLRLLHALKDNDMGFIIDHVPNHMAASLENPWWYDVLKEGPHSVYAPFFDIDWEEGQLVLPILHRPIEECKVEIGEDRVVVEGVVLPLRKGSQSLEEQYYRLCFWQAGREEINYRRFFDITSLVCVCVERDVVYEAFHEKLFELYDLGLINGIRLDHPDGLHDPVAYFKRLKNRVSCDVILEKILQVDESLRSQWPVEGTVGYESLRVMTNLFIDSEAKDFFHDLYEEIIGKKIDHEEALVIEKKGYLLLYLGNELNFLAKKMAGVVDVDVGEVKKALAILFAVFPVYRTYLDADGQMEKEDERIWTCAFEEARFREGECVKTLDKLERAFLQRDGWELFLRFQQLSPAIMAKGFEDTHCYTFHRFIALNEVGCNPDEFGLGTQVFHQKNLERLQLWPRSWQTGSTHDTKRSEDVRLRLAVLSEMPHRAREWFLRFFALAGDHFADQNMQYFYFQTLLGFWPEQVVDFARLQERLLSYMVKAAREAKIHTNWVVPNENYEKQLSLFVQRTLANKAFLAHLNHCVKQMGPFGSLNALAAWTLRAASPGVVDIYQGNEKERFDLVDPDNRRSVSTAEEEDDKKRYVIKKGLGLRRRFKHTILEGEYESYDVPGAVAFIRKGKEGVIFCVAGRFFSKGMAFREKQVRLPVGGVWQCLYTGKRVSQGRDFALNAVSEEFGAEIFFIEENVSSQKEA